MKQPHEILEELAGRGYAPTLLYDDDGHWLVVDASSSPYPEEPGQFTSYFHPTNPWHDNITDAVQAYLKETGEEV